MVDEAPVRRGFFVCPGRQRPDGGRLSGFLVLILSTGRTDTGPRSHDWHRRGDPSATMGLLGDIQLSDSCFRAVHDNCCRRYALVASGHSPLFFVPLTALSLGSVEEGETASVDVPGRPGLCHCRSRHLACAEADPDSRSHSGWQALTLTSGKTVLHFRSCCDAHSESAQGHFETIRHVRSGGSVFR
jgi:hypothetical protein